MKTVVFFFLLSVSALCAQENSHVAAHVPVESEFAGFLIRDAGEFLSRKRGTKLEASYELLRREPTQSGVAFPKFYVWVRGVSADKKVVVEGAMRVAAIEKKRFQVTDFISREEIGEDPSRLDSVFPRALIPAIKKKAEVK